MDLKEFSLLKLARVFLRWPLFFIVPFCLVIATVSAYVANLNIYRTQSIVIFQNNYIPIEEYFTLLDKFEDQPLQLVRSLLYGNSAKNIVGTIWPELVGNEPAVNGKIAHLRGNSGLELKFRRDNQNALQVAYESQDPQLAYQVVRSTLDELKRYNQEVSKQRLATSVEFLEEELEKTREELGELEQQIVRVRSGLPLSILESHDEKTKSIEEILDLTSVDFDIEKNLSKALKFDESIAELEFQLEIAQKELEQLQENLKTGVYLQDAADLAIVLKADKDPEVQSIDELIFQKKQALSKAQSQGFREAHPEIEAINKEIANLKQLKFEKLLELQKKLSKENEELTKLRLEKRQSKKIEDKVKEISLLRDRVKATKAYQDKFKNKNISLDEKLKELSDRKAKLVEFENKKLVTSHSYAQMTKRLAVIKREGRVDQDKFGINVDIVEPPQVPKAPMPFAGLPIIFLSAAITISVFFALAALLAMLDTRIYSVAELSNTLSLPVLGMVDSFNLKSEVQSKRKARVLALLFILIYSVCIWFYFKVR